MAAELLTAGRPADPETPDAGRPVEAFNVFNHPQFYGAGAVDGNIASPNFGNIVAAAAPRFIQLAAKFSF